MIHYLLKPCSGVEPILPLGLASMCSSTATPVCSEPTEAYPCLLIPQQWNDLEEPTGWNPFQRDSRCNSEGEILAIMS